MKPPVELSTIYRQINGEATAAETRSLESWRGASAHNEKTYRALERLWRTTGEPATPAAFDLEAGWRRLTGQLRLEREAPAQLRQAAPEPGRNRRTRAPLWWALVATAALLVTLAVLWQAREGPFDTWREFRTAGGQHYRVSLPDGSTVRLNAGSELRFEKRWRGELREVFLSGQAYFEVVHQNRPFLIHCEFAEVRVLGTRFDVWARNHKTRVVVRDGRVALSSADGLGELVLGAQQAAICERGKPPRVLESLDVESALNWVFGNIVYQRQALGDVVVDLEQLFGEPILLTEPELESRTVSASFGDERLETIIAELCLTLNLNYTYDGSTYRILP